MEFNKENLFKLWDLSVMSMNQDVSHEVISTPSMSSYSIQLPSFTEQPVLCNIQAFKIYGEPPRLSIIVGTYIEYASVEITEDEFAKLSQTFMEKNDIIEVMIREDLLKKAEKNLQILINSIQ